MARTGGHWEPKPKRVALRPRVWISASCRSSNNPFLMKPSVSRLGVERRTSVQLVASERFEGPRGMLTNLKLKSASARRLGPPRCGRGRRGSSRSRVNPANVHQPCCQARKQVRCSWLRSFLWADKRGGQVSVASVIWSSEQAHSVDALAAEGDEGRGSLR